MKNNIAIKNILVIMSLAVLNTCNYNGGVETTNGCTITASATDVNGTVPPYAQVFITSSNYLPFVDSGFARGTTADFSGNFECALPQGSYSLFVNDETSGKTVRMDLSTGDVATTTRKLGEPGTISGSVTHDDSKVFLVCLSGTPHYRLLSGKTDFRFGSVPAGDYRLIVLELDNVDHQIVKLLHEEPVTVDEGESVIIPEVNDGR